MKRESTSVTFRIDNDDLKTMRAQADDEKVSLNTLVNKILRHHNTWQRNCTAAGFMQIHRAILSRLVDAMDEKTLKEVAVQSANAYVESLLLMQGDTGLESSIELLLKESRASGFTCKAYSPDDKQTSVKRQIIIKHNMGAKWSVFLKEYVQQIIHNTRHSVQVDISSDFIIIKVAIENSETAKTLQKKDIKGTPTARRLQIESSTFY